MRGRSFDETPNYRYFFIRQNDLTDQKRQEIEDQMRIEILEQLQEHNLLKATPNGADDFDIDSDSANEMADKLIEKLWSSFWAEIEVDTDITKHLSVLDEDLETIAGVDFSEDLEKLKSL